MQSRLSSTLGFVVAIASIAPLAHADPEEPEPFRVGKALDAPSWLTLGLEHRTRAESTRNNFVAGPDADPRAFELRTLLALEATSKPAVFKLELQDSRTYANDDTRLNTTHVNPFEVLQAYLALKPKNMFVAGDEAEVKLGRITIDLGSRRLVARNDFRNTINGFTGFDAKWTSPRKDTARVFAVLPVSRKPRDPDELEANEVTIDGENIDALLWAMAYESRELPRAATIEAYVVGLHERDSPKNPSANRQLLTPGVRLLRKPANRRVDVHVEGALQVGQSRSSNADDNVMDLDHLAYTAHLEVGHKRGLVRVAAIYDHASGDRDRDDGKNQRFDPLFGARRFDFGPTGTYGPFARSNLRSPGLRVEVTPHARVDTFVAYRLAWLDSTADSWGPANLRDPDATSRFLGQQVEARVRWQVLPKNLVLEAGGAHLVRGAFARTAPESRDEPATYVYTQVTGTI